MKFIKSLTFILFIIAFAVIGCACAGMSNGNSNQGNTDNSSTNETVKLDINEYTMNVGDKVQLNAGKNCKWTVSDGDVISVNNSGLVTANGLGQATVTAEYNGSSDTCAITVTNVLLGEPVLSVDLKSDNINVSETTEIFPIAVFGSKVADNAFLDYSITSSDVSVVSVDGFRLKGIGEGNATIKVELTYKNSKYSVDKTVFVRNVCDIWFEQEEVSAIAGTNVALELKGVFSEENAMNNVSYDIFDKSILKYESGKFVALKMGTTTVTAKYKDITAKCVVRVCNTVSTAKEFLKIYNDTSANYIILDDIDLSDIDFNQLRKDFSGYIDGNGCTLSGISFNQRLSKMFNTFSGTIKNVSFENVEFKATEALIQTGLVAHTLNGARVENCKFDVKFYNVGSSNSVGATYVSWGYFAAVVAPFSDNATIKDCYISVVTPSNSKDDYIGAVVGFNRGELVLDNVIVEKLGNLDYAVRNDGTVLKTNSTGMYNRAVAKYVVQRVFDENAWVSNDSGVSLKKFINEFGGIVPYYVVFETENIYGGGYTEISREKHFGLIGTPVFVDAPVNTLYGFTFNSAVSQMSVSEIESDTELKLRFTRNNYKVNLVYGGKTETKTYKYQEICNLSEYSIKAPVVSGKVFIGWGKNAYESFAVAEDLTLSEPMYANEISSYSELLTIANEPSGNYVLTKDIDALADTGKTEVIWNIMDSFSGILDGNGFSIKNITLYNSNAEWYEKISMFDSFSGTLKDIGFVNINCSPTKSGYCNGIICRNFSGVAQNVYLKAKNSKTYYQYNGHQYGALFGAVEDGAVVRDCIIDYSTTRNSNTVSTFGYIAGTIKGRVKINNILIVKEPNVVNESGVLIANFEADAEINGVKCSTPTDATDLIYNSITDEDHIKNDAVTMFGSSSVVVNVLTTSMSVITVSSVVELYAAITSNSNANIALDCDIDCSDYTWTMIATRFTGTIDGAYHSIKNLTITGGTEDGHVRIGMFKEYFGTLRNISFDNAKINVYGCMICGLIASTFEGKANNVKVDVEFVRMDGYKDDMHRAGAMFGETGTYATIKNCFIKAVTPETYKIGYVAGRLSINVAMENIVVVKNANAGMFAMNVNSRAAINGTVVNAGGVSSEYSVESDALAIAAMDGYGLLIGTESEVIAGAGSILGSDWVCDGTKLPYLKVN